MPAMKKRSREAVESPAAATSTLANHNDQNQMSEYELSREQRIRENRERLGKLGIMDLSLKLKFSSLPPKRSYRSTSTPKTPPTLISSGPLRRSSSLCRQAKGWAPTGPLYKKIKALGYKSVAHYLVQTRRSVVNVEKNVDASNPVSANGSPPLSDMVINENLVDKNGDVSNPVSAKRSLPFSDVEINKNLDIKENHPGLMKPPPETESDGNDVSAKRWLLFSDDGQDPLEKVECLDTTKPLDSSLKPCSDSIARRLRPRLKKT